MIIFFGIDNISKKSKKRDGIKKEYHIGQIIREYKVLNIPIFNFKLPEKLMISFWKSIVFYIFFIDPLPL